MTYRPLATVPFLALLCLPALATAQDAATRPEAATVGIGVGMAVPAAPIGINTASARLRLTDSFTLEPMAGFTARSTTSEVDTPGGATETVSTSRDLFLGSAVRYHFAQSGRADAVGILGAGVDLSREEVDPEGTDNNTVSNATTVSISWGMGIEWYASPNWSVSADATNPIVSVDKTVVTDDASETEATANTLGISLSWSPTIRLMAHLYF